MGRIFSRNFVHDYTWINNGSGWIIESTESQYINISTYRPLAGGSYIDLPIELRSPRKGIINIKKNYKRLVSILNYDGIEFSVQGKDFNKIEVKNNICVNVFGYENRLVFPIYVSRQLFEDFIDLVLLIDDDESHYVYIKDFNRFMFH